MYIIIICGECAISVYGMTMEMNGPFPLIGNLDVLEFSAYSFFPYGAKDLYMCRRVFSQFRFACVSV
jgi:hypothetical protein